MASHEKIDAFSVPIHPLLRFAFKRNDRESRERDLEILTALEKLQGGASFAFYEPKLRSMETLELMEPKILRSIMHDLKRYGSWLRLKQGGHHIGFSDTLSLEQIQRDKKDIVFGIFEEIREEERRILRALPDFESYLSPDVRTEQSTMELHRDFPEYPEEEIIAVVITLSGSSTEFALSANNPWDTEAEITSAPEKSVVFFWASGGRTPYHRQPVAQQPSAVEEKRPRVAYRFFLKRKSRRET